MNMLASNAEFTPATPPKSPFPLVRAFKKACDVFGSEEKAILWLKRENSVMDGKTPLDMLSTRFGAEEVMDALVRVEYGVYS